MNINEFSDRRFTTYSRNDNFDDNVSNHSNQSIKSIKSNNSNQSNDSNKSSNSNKSNGEITGQKIDKQQLDRGMPMRSSYSIKKSTYDENKYLDFNLHEKSEQKTKIGYNDGNSFSSYAEISKNNHQITKQLSPEYVLSNGIENLGSKLYESILNTYQNGNFIVNSIGLYYLFAILYIASDNITLHELGKFFNFPKKTTLPNILASCEYFGTKDPAINIKNFVIIAKNIPYKSKFCDNMNEYSFFAEVDIKNITQEVSKLNFIVDKVMNTKMKNTITGANLHNLQVMFLTSTHIHPIWTIAFDTVKAGIFSGYTTDRKEHFLFSIGKQFVYYEDSERRLIEIPFGKKTSSIKNNSAVGFILHKKMQTYESNEKIHSYLSGSKMTLIEELAIPIFSHDVKLRFNNTFKSLGLNSVFAQIIAEDLFPHPVQLHDIIQNVKISIDTSSFNEKYDNKVIDLRAGTKQKFLINQPFMYYIRKEKTIIMNGLYQ